jgi:Tfp pilus assembly protein PilN
MMRRVDLLPHLYTQRRIERRLIGYVLVGGLAPLLVMVLWFMSLTGGVDEEKQKLEAARVVNAGLQAEIDELARFAALDAEVTAKESALRTVMTGDLNWPALMTQVAMVIPEEVWLDTLVASAGQTEGSGQVGTETAAIRISEGTPTGRIQFAGQALSMPSVAEWLLQLRKVDAFAAIWLNSASGSRGDVETEVFTFDSTLELGQAALSQRYLGELP